MGGEGGGREELAELLREEKEVCSDGVDAAEDAEYGDEC